VADYASAAEVFAAIAAREHEVDARLATVARARAGSGAFAASVASVRGRQRRERERLRVRLAVAPEAAAPLPSLAAPDDLARLREAQQELVHAHAEGLPALGDTQAVDVLARHLVELAAQLTVIDLWLAAGDAGG
jgi:hypothetical protein